jgi:hypothetical protein
MAENKIRLQTIVEGLVTPTHIAGNPLSDDIYVTDQPGHIYQIISGGGYVLDKKGITYV